MTMDKLFLALHVMGALMWVGSLFAVMAFLEAYAGEPEAAPRERLLKHLRSAAIVPDVGATIAMVFGAHWLFRFKLYEAHYMHAKLALVVLVLALHIMLRMKVRKARKGQPFTPPPVALKPLLTLTALGILIFVITKIPA
jgi:uncharacterized membrane protein